MAACSWVELKAQLSLRMPMKGWQGRHCTAFSMIRVFTSLRSFTQTALVYLLHIPKANCDPF